MKAFDHDVLFEVLSFLYRFEMYFDRRKLVPTLFIVRSLEITPIKLLCLRHIRPTNCLAVMQHCMMHQVPHDDSFQAAMVSGLI